MAELPRYQPTGYLPADVPRLDFANLKESVAMTQGISSALDRLSSFAFKEAAEKAQREGAQYGAENTPSAEQLLLATKEGKNIESLLAQPGTFFGDAARKIQAGQLRNELEILGRKELANLGAQIDSGSFDLEKVQSTIKAITNGYSKAISSVDAEEGLKFRASIAAAGNSVYLEATKNYGKMVSEGKAVLANDGLIATEAMIKNAFKNQTDPLTIEGIVKSERNKILAIAIDTGNPAFINKLMESFNEKIASAVVDHVMQPNVSITDGYLKLENGDLGKLSEVYKGLDKTKIQKLFLSKVKEKQQVYEANKSMTTLANETTANTLLIEYYSSGTTQIRKNEIGGKLARLGVLSADKIEKYLNPDAKDGDPYLQANIMYKVNTGQIKDLEELRKVTEEAGLSGRQYTPLATALLSRSKVDETNAFKKLSRTAGFGDVRPTKSKDNEEIFNKEGTLIGYYNEAKDAAILDRGSFNPNDVADAAISRYNNNNKADKQKETAQNDLNNAAKEIAEKKKIKGPFEINVNTNVDDLVKRGLIDADTATYIKKRQAILKGQQQ